MAIVYHRDQPGSPQYPFHTTAGNQAEWDAFLAIIKGCLIYGYGGRPAAGWELVHEVASYLVLRNGSKSSYVCFYRASSQVTVSVAATYTGVSGGLIVGDGVKTGKTANNSIPHKFSIRAISNYTQTTSWYLVADEKTFVLGLSTNGAGTSSLELTGNNGGGVYALGVVYCGEDDKGNFIVCGGQETTLTGITGANFYFSGEEGFTALRYPDTGLLVDTSSISVKTPGFLNALGNRYADSYSGLLEHVALSNLKWNCNGIEGKLRGCCSDTSILMSYVSSAAKMLGKTEGLFTRTVNEPIDLGDRYTYFVAPRYQSNTGTFLITDNPEFW